MGHRKNFQVIKHDENDTRASNGTATGKPTTARQARTSATAQRSDLPRGSSTWFGVEKTRRK